ncbi:hypothetical protein [Bosea sp. (in: a-proteobacteria)]|uniref:hypothetical protein n=1 Tax=Bosea sp. (in: a-proteobacteria) TaxID=1871050 RepID=UPI0026075432|nr:hypothetical protein [Bosea sp. (in: a-proteobacteria)]MCO5092017.1 hypothetical protein [Bosea sp. (in: a-proteobacteria)]
MGETMTEAKAWKRRSTSGSTYVDIDLSDFDSDQLLQALIDDDMISEAEALSIKERGGVNIAPDKKVVVAADAELVDDAWNEILRGRKGEALHLIEAALGSRWLGRLS